MPTTITRTSLLAMMAVAVAIAVIFAAGARPALADQDQAPTGLTLTATDANTVQATWTAHPDGARDYRLSWAPHDENFKTWTDTDWNAFPTGNSYAITGLEGGSTYKVKVRARFETGPPSDWSGIVTASTTAPPEPTPAPTPQPTPEATPEPAIDYDQERSASVSLGDITNAAAENRDETVDTDDPVDYFHFSLTHQRTVGLRIRRLDYNADLYVEDNDGAVIASSENGGDQKEVLNLTLAATGANEYYYVRVEAKEDGRNDYQLRYFTDAPPNAAATGAPTVSGAAQVRETLTAGVSGIADDNGLSNASFDYQWVRSVDGTDTDITGATGSTFLLTYDELDHTVRVRVSFTDDAGYPETLTSAATATVVRPPNASPGGQPAITGTVEVGETLTVGTSGISDPNGLSNPQYAYQWVRSIGSTDTDISGAIGSTYTLTASDLAHTVKVKASFTDDDGYAETLTSAPTEVPDTENSDCAEPPVGAGQRGQRRRLGHRGHLGGPVGLLPGQLRGLPPHDQRGRQPDGQDRHRGRRRPHLYRRQRGRRREVPLPRPLQRPGPPVRLDPDRHDRARAETRRAHGTERAAEHRHADQQHRPDNFHKCSYRRCRPSHQAFVGH